MVRKAELFGLYKDTQLQEAHRKILASANTDKRLLNTKEINTLCEKSHCNPEKLEELQRRLPQLINEAKEALIRKIPDITKPGGSLYPKERAEACWRDCFHLARISIYGTAAGNQQQGTDYKKEEIYWGIKHQDFINTCWIITKNPRTTW